MLLIQLSPRYNAPERVEEGCRASLKNLQLKYIDLYLIHWPVAMKVHSLSVVTKARHWSVVMSVRFNITLLYIPHTYRTIMYHTLYI